MLIQLSHNGEKGKLKGFLLALLGRHGLQQLKDCCLNEHGFDDCGLGCGI